MNTGKSLIMEFAHANGKVSAEMLVSTYNMNVITARQYLSSLAKDNELVRIGQGVYAVAKKQLFNYTPSELARTIYMKLKEELPFADFCIYDGSILSPLQHHLSINHAIYVETNRDIVISVFNRLKELYKNVYRQPSTSFMYDYIDLREECFIVKPLVTESPLMNAEGVKIPTLEKLLVDIQKDADFDYFRGSESNKMFLLAFSQFSINTQKLMRYAKRRGISQRINELTQQTI